MGKFIFSKVSDGSFEIQAYAEILNSGNPSLVGTIFTSLALRTNDSSIFEFRLINQTSMDAFLGILKKYMQISLNRISNFKYSNLSNASEAGKLQNWP